MGDDERPPEPGHHRRRGLRPGDRVLRRHPRVRAGGGLAGPDERRAAEAVGRGPAAWSRDRCPARPRRRRASGRGGGRPGRRPGRLLPPGRRFRRRLPADDRRRRRVREPTAHRAVRAGRRVPRYRRQPLGPPRRMTEPDYEPDPGRWHALAVTQVAGFMSLLDVSIVNVALPSIQRGLDASAGTAQWVVSGYALTFGLALVPSGRPGGWRWVFYVNVPIGVVALVLAARLVPSSSGDRAGLGAVHLDMVGVLLLGGGVLGLLLPLVEAESGGVGNMAWLLVAAVALLVAFARWESRVAGRGRQPLVDPRLARVSGYAAGAGIGLVYFLGYTGIWLVFARFFQSGLGYSPLRSGLAVTPFALGVAISAVIAGRLVARLGRWLTVSGLAGVAVG